MVGITFCEEAFDDALIEEMTPLLLRHKDEVCVYDDFEFGPNWELYKQMYESNVLHAYTARDDGVLIGYIVYTVGDNPHYKDVVQADQDVLYLDPDHRGFMLGTRLIKYGDVELAKLGVTLVVQHVKLAKDFSPILDRIGYMKTKTIHERRLN